MKRMLVSFYFFEACQKYSILLRLFRQTRCSFLFRFDNAEAKVVVPVIGVAPALVAHLAVVGVVVPAAAAVIAVAASAGIPEILVQVSAPLPNVAAHVV